MNISTGTEGRSSECNAISSNAFLIVARMDETSS